VRQIETDRFEGDTKLRRSSQSWKWNIEAGAEPCLPEWQLETIIMRSALDITEKTQFPGQHATRDLARLDHQHFMSKHGRVCLICTRPRVLEVTRTSTISNTQMHHA